MAVVCDGVTRRYGGRAVVDGLSFAVARGEVFALLGPNGAGKTTTVELLEGYRAPDAGRVRVLGLDPVRDGAALKGRMGLMLQGGGVYPQLRPLEALRLFAAFYADPESPAALLERLGLSGAAGTRYRHLSGGERQRLSLALALVGRPEIVFLDEPTAGMDPQARRATWDIVRELQGRGTTVLLTTHYLDEAERLASRIAIIGHGRLLALDTPQALLQGAGEVGLRFSAPGGLDVAALGAALGAPVRETEPGRYAAAGPADAARLARLTAWLAARDVLLTALQVGRPSLEEVYLRLTGEGAARAADEGADEGADGGAAAGAVAPEPGAP